MANADITARLTVNGEQFASEFRSSMGQIETQARATSTRIGSAFANVFQPMKSAGGSASVFVEGQRAADRLVASIDPLFAAQMRYNQALQQANTLQSTGMLTGQRYAQVQTGLKAAYEQEVLLLGRVGHGAGQARVAQMELMHVARASADQFAAGAPPMQIFTMHLGQLAQAASFGGSALGRVGTFLSGPWGIALTLGSVALATLIGKLMDTDSELEKASRSLEENARKADAMRQAHAAFAQTLPGIEEAIRGETRAIEDQNRSLEQNQQAMLARARNTFASAEALLGPNVRAQAEAMERLQGLRNQLQGSAADPRIASQLREQVTAAEAEVSRLRAENQRIQRDAAGAQAEIRQYQVPIAVRQAEALVDPLVAINQQYDRMVDRARMAAAGSDALTAALARQIATINRERNTRLEAERDRQRMLHQRPDSDGVQRFRSRPQAIGIAGRELIGQGFNVSENDQFGGVTARHTDPGHHLNDIDVNIPGAGAEADDPGTRDRLDAVARSYQARGYRVLWNRRIYEPGGDGPGPLIPAQNSRGQAISQHLDHLHLEAPASIVGRPTQSASGRQDGQQAQEQQRILRTLQDQTAQEVEGLRLDTLRHQGLTEEASLQERIGQMRRTAANDQHGVAEATAAVTPALQAQLATLNQEATAYAHLLSADGDRNKLTKDQRAAEDEAAASVVAAAQTARDMAGTAAEHLVVREAVARAEAKINEGLAEGNQLTQKRVARSHEEEQVREEAERHIAELKEQNYQREQDQIRELAGYYRDLFSGNISDIWKHFKDEGLNAIAEIAARWTIAMLTGQQASLPGILGQMNGPGGQGNLFTQLLGGLFGGHSSGTLPAGNSQWSNLANLGGTFADMGNGPAQAAGMLGGLGGLGSAVPMLGAGMAITSGLSSLLGIKNHAGGIFGIGGNLLINALTPAKRGSATLGFDPYGGLDVGASRGNSASRVDASKTAIGSVADMLDRIASALGGDVTGFGSVSLGMRDGNWRGDPTGRGITKTKNGAIDFGKDQEAAIRWAVGEALRDGVIGGISDASKRILASGQDLEQAIVKASMIEEIPKLLKQHLDPVGAALDALEEKWKKTIAALKEGGATAEQMADAQKLYKLELDDTIASTASASKGLKDFLDSLKMGPDSPYSYRDQEVAAKAALQPFLDKIGAGEGIDQQAYQTAAQTYLDIERQLYGSSGQFFEAMDQIMAATSSAIARIDSAAPIRTAVDPFVEATAANTGTMTEQLDQMGGLLVNIQGLLTSIAANNNGGSGFIGGGSGFSSVAAV